MVFVLTHSFLNYNENVPVMFTIHWHWQCFLSSKQFSPMAIRFQIEWRIGPNHSQSPTLHAPSVGRSKHEKVQKRVVQYSTTRNEWFDVVRHQIANVLNNPPLQKSPIISTVKICTRKLLNAQSRPTQDDVSFALKDHKFLARLSCRYYH